MKYKTIFCPDCLLTQNICIDNIENRKITCTCMRCRRNFEVDYKKDETTTDSINHSNHYNQGKYECIDVMLDVFGEDVNFCIGNAFKYLWRHGQKNGIEDIKKAVWYLQKYIELKENENED